MTLTGGWGTANAVSTAEDSCAAQLRAPLRPCSLCGWGSRAQGGLLGPLLHCGRLRLKREKRATELKEQGEQRTNLGHEESKVGGGAGALDQGVAGRAHHKHQGLTRDGDLRRCRHACSCVQEHVCVCTRLRAGVLQHSRAYIWACRAYVDVTWTGCCTGREFYKNDVHDI